MSNSSLLSVQSPAELGFTMPAEWAPHVACWMAWPTEHVQWDDLPEAEQAYADVANAIARFEPVIMLADPSRLGAARSLCGDNVKVMEMQTDDSWARDTGPSFIKHRDSVHIAGTDWRFNCWGGAMPKYQQDAQMASRILDHLGMDAYRSSLTFEGGAFHVDGDGTLVTTESVLLNENRNWGMDREQAEIELHRALGIEKVIWLPGDLDGITGDMTDGHVDGIMCFVEPGVAMFEIDSSADPEIAELERDNRRALELATDARGRKLEIIDMVVEHGSIGEGYDLFCSSYINFYLPNGGVVMPTYGVSADDDVRDLLSEIFPERKIVGVDINAIAPGGGGIHCITQQQPA